MDLEVILSTQAQGFLLAVGSRQVKHEESAEKEKYVSSFLCVVDSFVGRQYRRRARRITANSSSG